MSNFQPDELDQLLSGAMDALAKDVVRETPSIPWTDELQAGLQQRLFDVTNSGLKIYVEGMKLGMAAGKKVFTDTLTDLFNGEDDDED